MYRIINSFQLFENHGKLSIKVLNEILDLREYPRDKRLFIVDMMKKFELCYDIDPDRIFLVPDLLPKNKPYLGEWHDALTFRYHYNVLPSSIISRFIVRMNEFIDKPVWRSGVILKNRHNRSLVEADYEDRTISIFVDGPVNTRRDFLSFIRGTLEAIHKSIARIEVSATVPYPGYNNLMLAYEELLGFEQKTIETFPKEVDGQIVWVSVRKALASVDPAVIQQIFISYAHDDNRFVQKIARKLRNNGYQVWKDSYSLRGGES